MDDYSTLIRSPLPGLMDPRSLRGAPTDGELKARAARAKLLAAREAALQTFEPAPTPKSARSSMNAWGNYALDALEAPSKGSGKNGAWTKADIEGICND